MSKDEFSAKSKEQLAALATAFNILTPIEAEAMSQKELAQLLSREQKKSQQDSKAASEEAPKAKAKTAAKKAPAKTSKKKEVKEEAASEVKEEAKAETSEVKEAPKAEKAAKPSKRTAKKTKEEKPSEELPKEETAAKTEEPQKKEEAPKASKTSKRTTKKTKAVEPAKDASAEQAPAVEEKKEQKEEASSETPSDPSSEKKEDAKNSSKSKNNRQKKGAKKEEKPASDNEKKDEPKAEEVPQKETSENTPAETESKPENKEENRDENKKNDRPGQQKNKKQKSRHRSVEIRPAGSPSAPSENAEENTDEKAQAEGENASEPPKPQNEPVAFSGVLEIVSDGGYGFVRRENYLPSPQDIFVPNNLIRRFGLRMGDKIEGFAFAKKNQDKNLALSYITTVNDVELDKLGRRPHFERLTPIYPDERFRLETGKQELSTRIIDLVSPIGKGQRGMIVSPPKAGKTILLQKIANAISQNSPKTKLIVLLIDERPEEVTDMQRSIKGEVVYSTFDKKPENHTRVTELVLERAMRLVEMGEDVVILLDSMTRLARAYNLTITPTGRTLSGGLDPGSLYGPKRFFGAARNIENGGSLTIVATSLIETGSRMDEVIFEEFKGTGNMEVYLDRKLSEKRIFPAIDINKSGTRREDLLMTQEELDAVWTIRKAFSQMETAPVTETIINLLLRTNSNDHFIRSVKVSFADKEVFDAMRGTGSQSSTAKE